ncbi:MAG: ABC transporter permease [Candidatus Bathyarchaeia archaeon]
MRRGSYIAIRLLLSIPTVLLLATTVFVVTHILPGDPVRMMVGDVATEAQVQAIRHSLGLDRPLYIQYFDYLYNLLHLDFGTSINSRLPVLREIGAALPVTIELTIVGLMSGVAAGLPLGILAALKKGKAVDHILRAFSIGCYSIPIYVTGILLQLSLSWYFRILPVAGRMTSTIDVQKITGLYVVDSLLTLNFAAMFDALAHLILPGITLAIYLLPMLSRMSRASMIDALTEDYIVTARAKGLTESSVVYRHAFRNVLLPTITVIGLNFAGLLGGSVLTETVFSIPGLGTLMLRAINSRDFPMIQGIVVVYTLIVVAVNTVIDIAYSFLDPRVKY